MMTKTDKPRFQSGQPCVSAGRFSFDGYVDGSWNPQPTTEEMNVDLPVGESFPRIHSVRKACWWVPTEAAEVRAASEVADAVAGTTAE